MVLSKEELLQEGELKTEVVEIGKGAVIVSEICGADYIDMWSHCTEEIPDKPGESRVNMTKFTPMLIACAVVDENGNRLFNNEEVSRLAKLKSTVFLKLADAAKRLNGFSGDEKNDSSEIATGGNGGESPLPLVTRTPKNSSKR